MPKLIRHSVALFIMLSVMLGCKSGGQRVPGALSIPGSYDYTAYGASAGAVVGASLHEVVQSSMLPLIGAGSIMGGALGSYYDRTHLTKELERMGGHFFVIGDLVEVVLPTDYLFDDAEIELKEESYPLLGCLVGVLLRYGSHPMLITGYTDDIPLSPHGNEAFAYYRAQSVATFLWSHGIPNELITVQGPGMRPDVATNRTLEGSAANRRVVIHMWV